MMVFSLLLLVSTSFIVTLVHTAVSTDWKLTCYGEQLQIACDLSKIVVLHNAQFGFFKQIIGRKNLNVSCIAQQRGDCWIDVTPSMSRLCSGYSSCTTNVQYSLELPLDGIARECSIETAGFSKPSLFVEYSCVSTTLLTRLTSNSHVDSEQVGGYLATLDYAETRNGGTEWRMHQADAICRVGEEQLPYRFYLPAPNTQPHQPSFGLEEMVAFVLRIKDMSLTQPTTHSVTAENGKTKLRLATDQECSNLGQPCQQDYLEISAKLPSRHYSDASFDVIPVTRLCLTESATQSETPVKDSEATMIGRTFGPLPSAVGLQFRSNLNLRDSQVIPGKGILIEYIALFCTPIRNPTGYGIVDYRFLTLPHSSHTVAYAEIFCPSDRWLEPQRPTETEAIHRNQTGIPWWLERIQHTTRACNHHSRSWSDRIPEACLTEAELDVFVAKVKMDMEQASTAKINTSDIALSTSELETNYSVGNMTIEVPSPPLGHTAVSEVLSGPVIKAGSSVAVGVVLGFLICLMAVILIIYSLRHRLFAQYHKNETFPSFPDRMTRSASTFNQSTHSYYPTISSMDWRRKWNKSKWDLFKPWRVPPWSQNLTGTYPDLPRQTIVHGSSLGISRTPDTVVVDRFHPTWRTQLPRSLASSFSLNPGYPHPMAFENGEAANMSPWLRTNSTTRLARKPHFFASSSELVSPIDGQPQFSRSWWLPWRRSFRKQRRLYTQLLRRREAQYQSQRRLMPSNGISNSSSMHFGHLPSTPGGMFGSQSLMNSKIHLDNNKLPTGEREAAEGAVSQLTTQSTRTLINNEQVTANGISPRSDELASLYPVLKNKLHYNYTNVDPTNGYPSLYCQPITHQHQTVTADQVQNGMTANEPLPWKSTPPGNSLSQGFRRLSSFLRNLNGSLTPPRGSTRNTQQQRLAGQFYPQSMSGLNAAHYFQTGMNDPMFRRLSGPQPIPQGISARSRSESGSALFGLGMRSLYQISLSRGANPIASMYNLDVDDNSAFGDPLSGSTTTVTKTTRLGSTAAVSPGCGPDYWDQYPSVDVGGHRVSTASTIRPPTPTHYSQQQLMQQGSPAGHSAHSQLSQMINMSHSNDPYLVPASVKRRQVAQTTGDAHKMKYLSETERLPSGTSSAVSSLVFGDSAEEDQEVGDLISQPPQPPPPPPPPPALPTMAAAAGVPRSPSGRPLTLSEQVASGSPQGWTRFPIEYVTYDETHSCANTLIKPPVDDNHMQQDLIATQLGVPPNQQSPVKRRRHGDKGDETSRPLSDAMISNHYYTGTDLDMSMRGPMEQAPPRLPPRVNPPAEIAVSERSLSPKPNLPLPPLWNRPSQNGTPNKPEPPRLTTRDEYGSVDSLYETVDQYKPTEIRATSEQQINDQRMANLVTVGQESQLQRQKLALPPTPDSLESLRAPVASSDDDTGDEGEKPEKTS
ncbi:hypothetical protein CRM22_008891 [Opisthorchis felineus]|uniref:CUB domain-containing protein n=1 Tax=Opisthorchis felineus TaxID=147828 RepID=A0A4S2LG83_OPIFE|nr:hypothetical protein CRM22_008891 [Opisthorchis felineus]